MATLKYDFQIVGADAIAKAFKSVEDRAKEHSRKMDRVFSGAGGVGGGRKNWRSMIPAVPGVSEAQRMAQHLVGLQKTAAAKIAGEKEKAAKRAADKEIKEAKRSADAQAREAKKAADAQIREEKRIAKERDRENRKFARQQLRLEREQVAAANRKRATTFGALTDLGQRATGYAALGGGLLMGGIFAQGRAASKEISQLAMLARQTGSKTSMPDLYKNISGAVKNVSTRYGAERTTVLAAMRGFQGPAGAIEEGAVPMAGFLTAMSEATGADPTVTGELAGHIYRQLAQRGVDNKDAMEQTKRLMGAFAFQSAQESVEYKDFAQYGPRILGVAGMFGGGPEAFGRYAAILGQVAQLAPQGTAVGAAESTISVSRFVEQAAANKDKIKQQLGLDITRMGPGGIEELIAPEDLLSQVFARTKANPAKLKELGIDIRGQRAEKGLINLYKKGVAEGDKNLTEVERGALAIREYLASAADRVVTPEAIDKMVKQREEIDPFIKLEKAINRLINEAIDPLTPVVIDIANAIKEHKTEIIAFASALGNLVSWFATNPFEAVITLIMAKVAALNLKDLLLNPPVPTSPTGPTGGQPGSRGGSVIGGTARRASATPEGYNPFSRKGNLLSEEAGSVTADARRSGQGLPGGRVAKFGGNLLTYGPILERALNNLFIPEEQKKQGYGVFDKYLYRNTFEEYQRKESEKQNWLDNHPAIKALIQPAGGDDMPSWLDLFSSKPSAPGGPAPSSKQMLEFLQAMNAGTVREFTSALQQATESLGDMSLNRGDTPGQPSVSSGGR